MEPHIHLLFRPRPFPHLRGSSFSAPIPTRRPPTEPVPPAEQAASSVSRPPAKRTRRPMIAGPPIEGNLDCRDRSFHSETYFDIEALRQQPELRDSFRLLQRYHMESFLTPRQFYYPRVVIDFYQSMTTRGLRNLTLIQFTIETSGAIGARHIAEASIYLMSPCFRQISGSGPHSLRVTWSHFVQGDFYSLGMTRRELPSGMLLIDVLLRANLFPFSIKFRGEELYLRHYSGFLRAISSALIIDYDFSSSF
ncbi:hypothetical protein CK203_111187 [Vitis vinifera]|uniref:Uncharacterized protein n=1 Tax=Vitis vinifera TaxID=29760 RepID=A0A438BLU2_VITVI|nr:hypothetical protein CK203_111187 [Vitis vinifera]